jgi:hypothetical protein
MAEVDALLGYLNFSSGAPDPRFQQGLNRLFVAAEAAQPVGTSRVVLDFLRARLKELTGKPGPFQDATQAAGAIDLVADHLLPGYRAFHADLLFHQPDDAIFRPFFLARAFETVLSLGGPWDETDRIVTGAIQQLNDFIGYRPVAALEGRRIEPYPHEWVRPVPLMLRDAGVACGKYEALLTRTWEVLRSISPQIRRAAGFDPDLVDELAIDPRAFDFDHPANKRPNYMFGCWDTGIVDLGGFFRRFVIQQVTLDALNDRPASARGAAREELLFESAVVLAGTILMASGVTGNGPDAHDSTMTLMKLVGRIAQYRDAFYQEVLAGLSGPRGERLRAEAERNQQPFGAARQYLNHRLARLRAKQLQHVQLAQLFSRMGQPTASQRQAEVVPVASARILCQMQCARTTAIRHFTRGEVPEAAAQVRAMRDLLERGIQCGALLDPWNILGFAGNFSLFPAVQNSVTDHRIEVLIDSVEQLFALLTRWESEAAIAGDAALRDEARDRAEAFAAWWDQYASTEVGNVRSLSGKEAAESSAQVATALSAWRRAESAAGDVSFWRNHVADFRSPKAFGLVVNALLEKHDHVAAMALLMQWLAAAAEVPLVDMEHSFHVLAQRWLRTLWSDPAEGTAQRRWQLTRKFHDYLEANAEHWWETPSWGLGENGRESASGPFETGVDDGDEDDVFGAAYDEMTYRDTTDDGVEGDMVSGGEATDDEWDREWRRVQSRLAMLEGVSRWRKLAVDLSIRSGVAANELNETFADWDAQTRRWERGLRDLLATVQRQTIPRPLPTEEALLEYDRRRGWKDQALYHVAHCLVDASLASLWLQAARATESTAPRDPATPLWEPGAIQLLSAVMQGDVERARAVFPELRMRLDFEPILYAPLTKGGDPKRIVQARLFHSLIDHWLVSLPKLGLLTETWQLLDTARRMERNRVAGEGVVTEYDRIFETGFLAIIDAVVRLEPHAEQPTDADNELIESLQIVSEPLVERWLNHSRRVRLSVLERVVDERRWKELLEFIRQFGHDLFTQQFFHPGNMRAILHQGVTNWIDGCIEAIDGGEQPQLIEAIAEGYDRDEAGGMLALVLEAIGENFDVYRDFNTTTTQSDRGELIYMLLDMLRLKSSYDRFEWNLKPVMLVHQVLVRAGRTSAAETWRRAISEKTADVSAWHLKRLAELTATYGLRLSTIQDRLEERFVSPLAIDRMRALIRPAMRDLRTSPTSDSFDLLEHEVLEFADAPTGAGLDVPRWLIELEEEIARSEEAADAAPSTTDQKPIRLTWEQIERQLQAWLAEKPLPDEE